ncbi:hypothetical protein POSPLADRAFT_1053004 [Postia placenta MAD-698-R-SB12]|uniref:Uncharacterized protein n=1 Tax=Postia placenta MAD-698-R-SB12 TaxID=670580 RepID=A0A1X6ND96_9APHY|nr:hypothetical protein POSPLADRAFT_1053004 [Postia placenta MAD-698-R-SB12]OSX66353.1 hypothetical protein POSPLADRAFT_1053004 [Postia placenta MAD-698-R-SB12]
MPATMSRSLRKPATQPPRKAEDPPRPQSRVTLPALFARQTIPSSPPDPSSSQSRPGFRPKLPPAKPAPAEKARKNNAPPRPDQEVATISSSTEATHISISDSPSVICISSDSPAPMRQTRSAANKAASAAQKASQKPLTASTSASRPPPRIAPLPPLPPTPRRRSVVKPKTPLKRALDDDTDGEPDIKEFKVPRKPPGWFKDAAKGSSRSKPLTPKDNILPSPVESKASRRPSTPKRARLSPEEPAMRAPSSGNEADIEELVPSSQSDEHELTLPKDNRKDPVQVKQHVDKWRKETVTEPPSPAHTLPPSDGIVPPEPIENAEDDIPPPTDIPMDVDVSMKVRSPAPSRVSDAARLTPQSEVEVSLELRARSSVSTLSSYAGPSIFAAAADRSTTPPRSESPLTFSSPNAFSSLTPPPSSDPVPHPPTPQRITPRTKARQIADEIKAQVYARAPSSPEGSPLELQSLASSSDNESEDEFMAQLAKPDKGKGKAVAKPLGIKSGPFGSPLSNLESSPQDRRVLSRYNLRRQSPSVASRLPALFATADASQRRTSRKANPLDALLKEKALADKRGKGMDALRAAEVISSSSRARKNLRDELNNEDADADSAWGDEAAAMCVVHAGAASSAALAIDEEDESEVEDALQEEDCEKILGEKDGKAVGKILAKDRGSRETKRHGREERPLGVPLWDMDAKISDEMQVDGLPPLPQGLHEIDAHPVLHLLQNTVDSGDTLQLVTLLNANLLVHHLEPEQSAALVPWLFTLSMAPSGAAYGEPAWRTLLHICEHTLEQRPNLPLGLVIDCLVRLGAKPEVIEAAEWVVHQSSHSTIQACDKYEIVHRLVSLVTAFARRSALDVEEIPDFVLFMLLVALEPSVPSDLKRDCMVAVESLGQSVPSNAQHIDVAICSKVVRYARDLSPLNRAHLLSFIVGGSQRTIRIARCIARCLLLDEDPPSVESYMQLPPLAPIIDLLSPPTGSEALFDIQGNSDKDDYYDNLACHVEVLSKALTGIDEYVALEKEAARSEAAASPPSSQSSESGKKAGRETATPLEQVKTVLDVLHGKIVDTRAAHLDRSRAKATLQRLSLRIWYQRMASQRSGPGTGKPRNLHGYFGQPRK